MKAVFSAFLCAGMVIFIDLDKSVFDLRDIAQVALLITAIVLLNKEKP